LFYFIYIAPQKYVQTCLVSSKIFTLENNIWLRLRLYRWCLSWWYNRTCNYVYFSCILTLIADMCTNYDI